MQLGVLVLALISCVHMLRFLSEQIFSEDLQEIVSLVEGMPDNERKLVFLREVIHSLRSLRTAATLNSHFIALSSLCAVSLKQV